MSAQNSCLSVKFDNGKFLLEVCRCRKNEMTSVHTVRIHYLPRRCYILCPAVRVEPGVLRACSVLLFQFET